MSFRTIRDAQQAIWPAVRKSIELHRTSREATKQAGRLATAAAQARARVPWNRVVANEAVWAIAKADLLATQEQVDVVEAAKAWANSWKVLGPPTLEHDDVEDVNLYKAIQVYCASLEISDEVA